MHRTNSRAVFDLGEWKSEVASRKNPDGTVSMVMISPGLIGEEGFPDGFLIGSASGKRTLTVRDMQRDYVFVER